MSNPNPHIAGGLDALESMASTPEAPATPAPTATPAQPPAAPEASAPAASTPDLSAISDEVVGGEEPEAPKAEEDPKPADEPKADDLDDKLYFEHEGKRYYTQKGLDKIAAQRAAKLKNEKILEEAKKIANDELAELLTKYEEAQAKAAEAEFYLKVKDLSKSTGVPETALVKIGNVPNLDELAGELGALIKAKNEASEIQHGVFGGSAEGGNADPFAGLDKWQRGEE